jgi:tryptophan 7-halogenase
LEPLESTSIHLIMTGITRLMQLFPFAGIQQVFVDQYNEDARIELERIRDFLVLHYYATERDTPFWRYCKGMEIPESLKRRIEMFRQSAHAYQLQGELFRVDSWTQVMLGQGIEPLHHHPAPNTMSDQELNKLLIGMKASISDIVAKMPPHQEFIDRYCAATRR